MKDGLTLTTTMVVSPSTVLSDLSTLQVPTLECSSLLRRPIVPRKPLRVLIISALTGWGHKRIAEALADAIEEQGRRSSPKTVHIENVLEASTLLNKALSAIYNWILRHAQAWMFVYYHLINLLNLSHQPLILEPMRAYAEALIKVHQPDLVISVHPMLQYFGGMLQRAHAKQHPLAVSPLPLYTVVSDPCYGFWKGWAYSTVSHYFTATPGASQQLSDYGVPPQAMSEIGLPMASYTVPFNTSERQALRKAVWGERADRLTLFFNAGWAGGGSIEALLKDFLASGLHLQVNIIFQTGSHTKLKKRWQAFINGQGYRHILLTSTADEMTTLYALSDAMITKPGASTVFESLHYGVPLLIDTQKRLMPQEAGTADWLEAKGMGHRVSSVAQLQDIVRQWLQHPSRRERLAQRALAHATPHASQHIVQAILKYYTQSQAL